MNDDFEQARVAHAKAGDVFKAACDLPPHERTEYIERACAGDAALLELARSLLRHDEATGDLLADGGIHTQRRFAAPRGGDDDAPFAPPERVGQYRILRRIGGGGMGEVYEAMQESPDRRVAVKMLHAGAETRQLVQRFRREGQIQARLSHPGIAGVYEAGVHVENGRSIPYLAMELVEGAPIVDFCRDRNLAARRCIELIIDVCDAVSHAHQRGVIHRDLKPDNILVHDTESGPRAKVLDFGVAKLIGRDQPAATMQTEAGAIVGTLSYMSPEQLSGNADAVDTRTDIYALGLILYHLLGGQPAHQVAGLALPAAVRRITEREPTALGTITPALRGDAETIVHKSIARDKSRRYASASEMAADLRRYLADEPIAARPASAVYQLGKFARRNRALVTASALALVALLAGVVGTTLQARAAVRARDEARRQAERAQHESDIARSVAESLRQVFYFASPEQAKGKDPTLREAIAGVDGIFKKDDDTPPEAEAIVRNVAGIVQRNYGEYDKSLAQFEKSLEIRRRVLPPDDPAIAESLQNIAMIQGVLGHPEQAVTLQSEALEIQRRALDPDSPVVARTLFNLARNVLRLGRNDEALKLTRESLALHERIAPDNKEVLGMHHEQIAAIQRSLGDLVAAEASGVRSVELVRSGVAKDHPTLAVALLGLAKTRLQAGNAAGADEPSREAEQIAARVFASRPDHPTAVATRETRAAVLAALASAPVSTPTPAQKP